MEGKRSVTYEEDPQRGKPPKVVFEGTWNNMHLDKLQKFLRRELRIHKTNLRRKEDDRRRIERGERGRGRPRKQSYT